MVTKTQMSSMVRAGREAIERRMFWLVLRQWEMNDKKQAELDQLTELLKKYNDLMAGNELPPQLPEAANDTHGGRA